MYIADPRQVPTGLYLYTLRPVRHAMLTDGPTPDEQALAARHWTYSQDLLSRGALIFAGRTMQRDPTTFAFAVVRAASLDAARARRGRSGSRRWRVRCGSLSFSAYAHGCMAGRSRHGPTRHL